MKEKGKIEAKDLLGAKVVDFEELDEDELGKIVLEKDGKQFLLFPTETGGILFYEEAKL